MSRALRIIGLPLALGFTIALVAAGTYWGLEVLLARYADHDRGLWEGAGLVTVINGGHALVNRVLKRLAAKKEPLP